jgi:hypothetical protein
MLPRTMRSTPHHHTHHSTSRRRAASPSPTARPEASTGDLRRCSQGAGGASAQVPSAQVRGPAGKERV